MFYPAYVHKDPGSAYGITLPDFPGCFTAADDLQELPRQVQEAVELHFEGENLPIPVPTTPDDWAGDDRFQGGRWMLVDINVAALNE
ncbi:type II toxin-antitoxin system HicB family antitoxin [Achromobacter denitrificans]|uniref:Type II toxin-antitoxin system HicB family antitoxin n=1 Tax=Achromobacter denitrificans TaxID=32002 RepID=A0ABZ3FUH6_ACHDE|nr:HicB family protein [Achromobacter denitrificans]